MFAPKISSLFLSGRRKKCLAQHFSLHLHALYFMNLFCFPEVISKYMSKRDMHGLFVLGILLQLASRCGTEAERGSGFQSCFSVVNELLGE